MIRLDRWLVTLGIGSRSQVQKMIRSGMVTVNGTPERDPGKNLPEDAALALKGEKLDGRLIRHVILNKPAGLLTAARDKKQPTVMDLLPPVYTAIGCMPVGRLDKDTTGLLLFTCDGEMNHRMLAPTRHVDKVYRAVVDGPVGDTEIRRFAEGLKLSDFEASPAELVVLRSGDTESETLLTIHEGKFHQVKRMFEAVGRTVTHLHREQFGPLLLPEDLPEGCWRELTDEELQACYQAADMSIGGS